MFPPEARGDFSRRAPRWSLIGTKCSRTPSFGWLVSTIPLHQTRIQCGDPPSPMAHPARTTPVSMAVKGRHVLRMMAQTLAHKPEIHRGDLGSPAGQFGADDCPRHGIKVGKASL